MGRWGAFFVLLKRRPFAGGNCLVCMVYFIIYHFICYLGVIVISVIIRLQPEDVSLIFQDDMLLFVEGG